MVYLPVKLLIYLVTNAQREKAVRTCYVSIKATDMIASYKVLYTAAIFPLYLLAFCVTFFLTSYFLLHVYLLNAIKLTILFGIILPVYFYLAVRWFDELMYNGRMFLLRIKYFKFYRKRGLRKLRELEQLRHEIVTSIHDIIDKYEKNILAEDVSSRIISRRKSEPNFEAKLDQISHIIGGFK